MEFVEKAKRGDLSFIKRIPLDQVIGRIEIGENPENPGVYIPSPIVINEKLRITIDLDTVMMIDDSGNTWGKWILWIDPLRYPLEGKTEETFVMNWLNRAVDANVSYVPSAYESWNTIFGDLNRYFRAVNGEPLEDVFLAELGLGAMFLSYWYEARTGIFLMSHTNSFFDDFLTQKLGVVATIADEQEDWAHLSEIVFVGDLNSDWVVNKSDLTIVARVFRTKPGYERWNQTADLNKDGIINILDIAITAKAFGTQYITTD